MAGIGFLYGSLRAVGQPPAGGFPPFDPPPFPANHCIGSFARRRAPGRGLFPRGRRCATCCGPSARPCALLARREWTPYLRTSSPFGGRREIVVVCGSCQFQSSIPPAAISRNSYFCSSCGKAIDLLTQAFRPTGEGAGGFTAGARRDRGNSRYKSARKGRR
jgi:hypothetical protein